VGRVKFTPCRRSKGCWVYEQDLDRHVKSGNKALIKKISSLLQELEEHPTTGTGKPERMTGDRQGQWSRRINHEHRLIYLIDNKDVIVTAVSAFGHYDDK
jgi:toxin YoeB